LAFGEGSGVGLKRGSFVIALALLFLLFNIAPAHAEPVQQIQRTIAVVGEGRVTSTPDVASITLGVEVLNTDLQQAVMDVESRMSLVRQALEEGGIAEQDIQLTRVDVTPQDLIDPRSGSMTGQLVYRVLSSAHVIVREVDAARQVVSAAVTAGANVIGEFGFGMNNMRSMETAARTSAISSAYERAGELAAGLGLLVGDPLQVEELSITRDLATADAASYEGGAGQIAVTVQIRVVFSAQVGAGGS